MRKTRLRPNGAQAPRSGADPATAWLRRGAQEALSWHGPMVQPGLALAGAWADMVGETSAFLAGQVGRAVEAQRALMRCNSPSEVLSVHADVLATAVDDFVTEAGRLSDLLEEATRLTTQAEGGSK